MARLAHDLPPWGTCHYYYRRFRLDGTWARVEEGLRARLRKAAGRNATPTAAVVDSQSIATASGGERGLDPAKKVAGRERHIAVDTMGLLLAVVVHSAAIQDRDGVKLLLSRMNGRFPRLRVGRADGAYAAAVSWAHRTCGWLMTIVTRPAGAKGFVVLPKRCVVERTFAWLLRWRRMGRDYERTTGSSEAMIRLAMIHLMVRRRKCSAQPSHTPSEAEGVNWTPVTLCRESVGQPAVVASREECASERRRRRPSETRTVRGGPLGQPCRSAFGRQDRSTLGAPGLKASREWVTNPWGHGRSTTPLAPAT